jgi:hypothetical protein
MIICDKLGDFADDALLVRTMEEQYSCRFHSKSFKLILNFDISFTIAKIDILIKKKEHAT